MSKQDWCNIPVKVTYKGIRQWRELRYWLSVNVDDFDYDCTGQDVLTDRNNRVIYFARRQDAVMFALRWA